MAQRVRHARGENIKTILFTPLVCLACCVKSSNERPNNACCAGGLITKIHMCSNELAVIEKTKIIKIYR